MKIPTALSFGIFLILFSCKESDPVEITHLNENWYVFQNQNFSKPAQWVTSITQDRQNNIWAGFVWDSTYTIDSTCFYTHSGNYLCLPIDTVLYSSYIVQIKSLDISSVIDSPKITALNHYVSAIGFNQNNVLDIGIFSMGILEYNGQTSIIHASDESESYLYSKFIYDADNNTWFGAGGHGLIKFGGGQYTNFYSFIPSPGNVDFLNFDSKGILWFNTPENLIRMVNDQIEIIPFSYSQQIHGSVVDNNDSVWIISLRSMTLDDGYSLKKIIYNPSDQWATTVDLKLPKEINWLFIADITIDSKNNFWIATQHQGLLMFDRNKWTFYNKSNSQIQSDNLTKLFIDKFDNIWIGSGDNGLAILNPNGISY